MSTSMSAARLHPTAIVDPQCELSAGVEIGPYCVLSGKVVLGEGVRLIANVHMMGPVKIGAGTIVFPGAAVGFPPQDYKFKPGDPTAGVVVGESCIIREHATIHAASKLDHPTTLGDRVFMMACSHVGHDTRVGDQVILVNGALLAGHVVVERHATLSGLTAIHQFGRVGRLAFLSGGAVMSADLPPFCVSRQRNRVSGLNVVGLRRAGVPREQISALRSAFREAFIQRLPRQEMVQCLDSFAQECPAAGEMARFIERGTRSIATYDSDSEGDE